MSQAGILNRGVFPPFTVAETLTGNTGGAVGPDGANNIDVVGDGTTITVAGNPGTHTLTISALSSGATSFPTDSGTATPSAGVLNIIAGLSTFNCGATVEFTGSGNTVELHVSGTGNAHNTLIGLNSGQFLSSGTGNTGLGYASLNSSPTGLSGSFNTCIGESAGADITSSQGNCAWGAFALQNGHPGSFNIVGGFEAATNWTGGEDSNIIIGNPGVASESNTIRIGTTGSVSQQQNKCFIAGIAGVNLATANVVVEASDQLGTAVITAGTGISVTAGANTITIAATATSFTWSVIAANQTAAVNNGYFCNKAGTLALALPAVSALGDIIEVTNENTALGVQFTQAAGQQILIGNTNTTLGAGGTLTSSAVGDTLKIVCMTANTIWRVTSLVGNWSPV